MQTVDITVRGLVSLLLFLLVPMGIMAFLKVRLIGRLALSVLRMGVQLVLVGLYLRYLFAWNHPAVTLGWLMLMVVVASGHILKSASFRRRELLPLVIGSVVLSLALVLVPFMALVVQPDPLYDARYLIPLGGMVLGNFLSGNIVALNAYGTMVWKRRQEVQSALCFGATRREAVAPLLREAFTRAITPSVTTIGTLGLVSLPGMMTGQLLGGSVPVVAIKYQIAIMVAIVTALSLSLLLTLFTVTTRLFDSRERVREELFCER